MIKTPNRKEATRKRHYRLRRRLIGSTASPRLAVYRSSKHIYAQLIDDTTSVTLVSASSNDKDIRTTLKSGANIEAAKTIGTAIAKKAQAKGITSIVFDRGGNLYHGRIQALADAAREAGLQF
ncbi:MAG: 50S ribosomal protein L18 [Cyanobacteria bacterium]|jgi:large subunit ribosomal protein L18|nr:50S ribosomal protein L18 [Cyanobacteriota bacterium]